MGKGNFTEEFKGEAVRRITVWGNLVAAISQPLGVSQYSLYEWQKKFGTLSAKSSDEAEEIRRLKRELVRVTEERDILKKRPRTSPGGWSGRVLCSET